MRNPGFARYVMLFSLAFSLVALAAYGYPATFEYPATYNYAVSAKWTNNLNFMVCLSGVQEREYKDLFLQAVEEWKQEWDHFGYRTSNGSGCHINVHIVKSHSDLSEHGHIGYTLIEYWERGAITKADIILPTHEKIQVSSAGKDKTVTTEYLEPISKTLFYRAALHEFGHALNLGHFDDNGEEPIDIMHPYPADDDQEQGISQRNIEALSLLYLGSLEKKLEVRTDKNYYHAGDMVKISGKVDPVVLNELVRIEVLDADNDDEPYKTDDLSVDASGGFSYKWKISREVEGGSFKIKASYNSLIENAWFDIRNDDAADYQVGAHVVAAKESSAKMAEPGLLERSLDEENVTILETSVVDNSGFPVSSINSQEQVFIRSSISSTFAEQKVVTYIIQISDLEGYTAEISSATPSLPTGSSTFTQSWLPASPGEYRIQVFLWIGALHPEPLTDTHIGLDLLVT